MKPLLVLVFLASFLFTTKPAPVQAVFPTEQIHHVSFAQDCQSPYITKAGDSLRKIASLCNFKVAEIIAANPQIANPNIILVGQQIHLPGQTQPDPEQAAQGQTDQNKPMLNSSAATAGEEPPSATESKQDSAEPSTSIPVTGQSTYQIRPGDSLGRVASQHGVSISQIMFANPELRNPNLIYPGQEITIPPASLQISEEDWKEQRIDQSLQVIESTGIRYNPSPDEHWIHVDLASQTVHAYEGNERVRSFVVSTGRWQTPTVTGTYKVWVKFRYDDMSGPGYHLKDVPYVMYFYRGYGLHGTYWHNNFGTPMSHGCVNLRTEDAAWLFDFASVGTVVNVQ